MKLFLIKFSFILLFSTIAPQIAICGEDYAESKRYNQPQWEWETEYDEMKFLNTTRYCNHRRKNLKNKYKHLAKKKHKNPK